MRIFTIFIAALGFLGIASLTSLAAEGGKAGNVKVTLEENPGGAAVIGKTKRSQGSKRQQVKPSMRGEHR